MGIVLLGFVTNVLLKQTYNFIFIIGQKPFVWMVLVAIVGIVVWGICAAFDWSVNIPAWASTMAFFMNLPPGHKNPGGKESAHQLTDEIYAEMGIKNGRILYRLGLTIFVFSCFVSWVLFYGESCSGNECQSIIENIFQ